MNEQLLQTALKRLLQETAGVTFGFVNLRVEIREGKPHRFVFSKESAALAGELEGAYDNK